jgi:putative transposase
MRKSRFSEAKIISVLKYNERGEKVPGPCREIGVSDATFYNWQAKYGVLSASDLKRLKDLEAENARLKKMYTNLSLVHDALKDAVEKSSKPRREAQAGHAHECGAPRQHPSGLPGRGPGPKYIPVPTEAKAG